MTIDTTTVAKQDSGRKHRRQSSDEETDEKPKYRKHHHHRRSHHHRSKKHEGDKVESENDANDDLKDDEYDDTKNAIDSLAITPISTTALDDQLKPDSDIEEGEIVDDTDYQNLECCVLYNKLRGHVEQGDHVEGESSFHEVQQEIGSGPNLPFRELKTLSDARSDHHFATNVTQHKKDGSMVYRGNHASRDYDGVLDKVHSRSRSRSHESVEARVCNKSVTKEISWLENTHDIWEDERKTQRSRRHRHGEFELARDDEECNTYYSRKEERDINMSNKRSRYREQEISWSEKYEHERRTWVEERERSTNVDRDQISERDSYMRAETEIDLDRRWERGRDRHRDRTDNVRYTEDQRDGARGRDMVSQRGREDGRDTERNWAREEKNRRYSDRDKGGDIDSPSDYRYGETEDNRDRSRKNSIGRVLTSKNSILEVDADTPKRDEDEQDDDEEMISALEQEEKDMQRIQEESRRRKQAILEKYKCQQVQQQVAPHLKDANKDELLILKQDDQLTSTANVPEKFIVSNDRASAHVSDSSLSIKNTPMQNGLAIFNRSSGAGILGEGTPKSDGSKDIFCDDIFGDSPAGKHNVAKGGALPIQKSGLHDNWDDAEGYYGYRFGENLDGRYEIIAGHGKGVFSNVVRAKDLKAVNGEQEVAIKIIRNNETMFKLGQSELIILKKLVDADPEDKRHCVRYLSSFKYRDHLCLVFESLHMNLREVIKKFGRNIGLKLTAVRVYAKQLFIALKHLRKCGVLHCDIKPDNMLVNEAKNVLKLCDFGSAMLAGKNEITPYLVSRFYRAPEIILGLPYDHSMDIWSVGCCLYELYTGKILFPGHTNNDMLRLHMELKGPFPKKILRKGGFVDQHFDQDFNFIATEEDPVSKKAITRIIHNIKAKDIGSIITSSPGEDSKMSANFKDLLDKIFVLDPEKRMTVSQALSHPFITGK